jgi:hypothetical protein
MQPVRQGELAVLNMEIARQLPIYIILVVIFPFNINELLAST